MSKAIHQCICFAVVVGSWFCDANAQPSDLTPTLSPEASAKPKPVTALAPALRAHISIRKVHLKCRHKGYVVDIKYPKFIGVPAAVIVRLNRTVKHTVDSNIPAHAGTGGRDNSYTCTSRPRFVSPKLASIDFEFQHDESDKGQTTYHVPFNYNVTPVVKSLSLKAAFGGRIDYAKLSDLCIESLSGKLKNALALPANTQFEPKTFNTFSFDLEHLYVTFSEGHVAAVEFGCPTAEISYRELRTMLSRKSPIASLVYFHAKRHRKK